MSLVLLTGKPGSGKSFNLVNRWILNAISKIGTPERMLVYTNVAGLNFTYLSIVAGNRYKRDFLPEDIENLFVMVPPPSQIREANQVIMSMPHKCLLIIDEAQKYWNNRDFKSEYNKEILAYFQEHRRRKHNVVLATQHFEQLDIGIRRLTEAHYRLSRMKSLGISMAVKVEIFEQGETVDCKIDGRETWYLGRSIFKCYTSYEVGGDGSMIKEHKGPNIFFSNYKLWVIFSLFIVCVVWFCMPKKEIPVDPNAPTSSDFLGVYDDYYCARGGVYILRYGGRIDTLPERFINKTICPSLHYQPPKKEVKK